MSASRSERTLDSPGMERGSPWGSRSDAAQRIGGGGGIAAGDVDVPPVGGGDEPAVGASLSRIARLVRKSCADCRGAVRIMEVL